MSDTKIKVIVKKKIPTVSAVKAVPAVAAVPSEQPMSSIISFDVGIINLAYCIMTYSVSAGYTIYDWGIINLANGNPKLVCTVKLASGARAGQKCGKKAIYSSTDNKSVGMCQTHANAHSPRVRNITVDNVTELELKCVLFEHLRNNPKFLEVGTVLIEHQPLKAREKIKGIGHALFDYYVLSNLIANKEMPLVKFIDAKNKLTVYDGPPLSCHLKTQYPRNKWYSVKYCQWILSHGLGNGNDQTKYFNDCKKQDDLADCFLQGLWYLKYGRDNKQTPMTSSHQKLVYRENNRLQYKKVRARAPSKKTIGSGRYTLSNLKYLMAHGHSKSSLKTNIEFFFGDLEYFDAVLKNQ